MGGQSRSTKNNSKDPHREMQLTCEQTKSQSLPRKSHHWTFNEWRHSYHKLVSKKSRRWFVGQDALYPLSPSWFTKDKKRGQPMDEVFSRLMLRMRVISATDGHWFFFNGRLSLIQQKMSVKQRLSWLPPSLSSFLGLAISCSVLFLGCKLNNLILNVCSLSPVSSDLHLWGLKKTDHCMFFSLFLLELVKSMFPRSKG